MQQPSTKPSLISACLTQVAQQPKPDAQTIAFFHLTCQPLLSDRLNKYIFGGFLTFGFRQEHLVALKKKLLEKFLREQKRW